MRTINAIPIFTAYDDDEDDYDFDIIVWLRAK